MERTTQLALHPVLEGQQFVPIWSQVLCLVLQQKFFVSKLQHAEMQRYYWMMFLQKVKLH